MASLVCRIASWIRAAVPAMMMLLLKPAAAVVVVVAASPDL